jgi:hypothetical protein
MAQITIYLDNEVLTKLKASVKAAGGSKSQWIADAIRMRVNKEWPASVRALAGAWPDFPAAAEIRRSRPADVRRERL